jgi:hypothetical protein
MGSPPFIPRITYLNAALATKSILVTLYPPSTWRLLHDETVHNPPSLRVSIRPDVGSLDRQSSQEYAHNTTLLLEPCWLLLRRKE